MFTATILCIVFGSHIGVAAAFPWLALHALTLGQPDSGSGKEADGPSQSSSFTSARGAVLRHRVRIPSGGKGERRSRGASKHLSRTLKRVA
jgi:hypothetical protein